MLDTTTEARLREEEIIWLTTVRSDGHPQSGRQKLKNIGTNPRVGLHLNSNARGGDVVRAEGTAEVAEDVPPATEIDEYVEKYRESIARIGFEPDSFARTYSVALRVTPTRWRLW
jgi:PPOX class probable F420-dependent enzyme